MKLLEFSSVQTALECSPRRDDKVRRNQSLQGRAAPRSTSAAPQGPAKRKLFKQFRVFCSFSNVPTTLATLKIGFSIPNKNWIFALIHHQKSFSVWQRFELRKVPTVSLHVWPMFMLPTEDNRYKKERVSMDSHTLWRKAVMPNDGYIWIKSGLIIISFHNSRAEFYMQTKMSLADITFKV